MPVLLSPEDQKALDDANKAKSELADKQAQADAQAAEAERLRKLNETTGTPDMSAGATPDASYLDDKSYNMIFRL